MAKKQRMTAAYKKTLWNIVNQLFDEAHAKGWTWAGFAQRAGVAETTVFYLGNRNTRFPQFRTLQMLAEAVGGTLTFKHGQVTGFKANKKIHRLYVRDVRKPRLAKVG